MAQKIVIAEIDVNIDALIKSTSTLKKEIDAIKQEQKELANAGDTSSKQFVKNAADLKVLGQAYNSNIKAISENTQAIADQTQRTELLNQVIGAEVTSIKEARAQNQLLNKLRNETNVTTDEGRQELEKLNAQLDRNNAFIKDNADAYLKQKINVGNYTENIKEAFSELNIFNGGLGGFIQRSQEAGGVGNLLGTSLKGAATGFLGLAKASLAFIATPIGAVLALLVGAFALIKNAMNRSEDATNKLKISFSAITGIFNTVLKALEPLGEFLIDGIVMGFEKTLEVAEKARVALAGFLDFLGFEDGAKAVLDFNDAINEGIANAQALATAEAELEKAQRQSRLTQLQYQKDAEKLRQQRDDESNSISERIALNDQLGLVLQQQLAEELRIAEQALIVANLRIEAEGQTKETLDEQSKALTEIADIQERITGQESEQLSNLNSLRREAAAQAKEAAQNRIELAENELELLREQRRFNEQNLEEAKFFADEEIKIFRQKLKDRLLSETEFQTEKLRIENDLKQKQIEADEQELQRIKDFDQRKKDLENELELLRTQDAEEKAILKAQQDFEKQVLELENLKLTEQQKTDLLVLIEQERDLVLSELRQGFLDKRVEAELEANKKLTESDQLTVQVRQQLAQILTNTLSNLLGQSLGAKLASIAIEAAIAAGLVKLESAEASGRVSANIAAANAAAIAASPLTFGQPFVGVNTAQGAVLQTGIATSAAQSISRILAGAAIKGIGTIASGVGNRKLEQGGIVGVGGKRHSQGGTKFYGEDGSMFEAEKGEGIGVLNRGAYASFLDFNNRFGSGGTTRAGFAEGGGIITRAMPSQNESQLELLQAIQNLPTPVVTVEDIRAGNQSYVEVMEGGNV